MKLRLVLAVSAILLSVAASSTAHAQDDTLNAAREAFEEAQGHYAAGKYVEAASAFQKAFDARPFPQFLFNIGASFEKLRQYDKAVDYYGQYIEATENAEDKAATKLRIEILKKEIERLEKAPPDPDKAAEPSEEVKKLAEARIRGLVVIETKPQGATIYLDDKKGKPIGRTPWNGSLEGEHTVFLVQEGYRPVEQAISPATDRLVVLVVPMAEEDYLGFVDITSNIPESEIYVDDKSVGVYQRTPWKGNLTPGKHKIWITKDGYDEYYSEINVVAGESLKVEATLKGRPVGYLNFRGADVDKNKIYVDGKVLCPRGPCRHAISQGAHKISVRRGGYKNFNKTIDVQARTEMTVYAKLAVKPGRGDAIFAYAIAAAFAGGGLLALNQAQNIRDELDDEIAANNPGVTQEDSRFTEALIWTIGGHTGLGLAAIGGAVAVYYTFRDKGPKSTGTVDVKAVAVQPHVGPGYAGLGIGGSF